MPDIPKTRNCLKCGKEKTIDSFRNKKNGKYGKHAWCRNCEAKGSGIWNKNNPAAVKKIKQRRYVNSARGKHLREKYGITEQHYQELFVAQGGVCKICGQPERKRFLNVDHDHTTGRIRGLLCRTCNWGLGHFKDDRYLLLKAIDYLGQISE